MMVRTVLNNNVPKVIPSNVIRIIILDMHGPQTLLCENPIKHASFLCHQPKNQVGVVNLKENYKNCSSSFIGFSM